MDEEIKCKRWLLVKLIQKATHNKKKSFTTFDTIPACSDVHSFFIKIRYKCLDKEESLKLYY